MISQRSLREVRQTGAMKATSSESAIVKPANLYPVNWKQIGIEIRRRAENPSGQEQCEPTLRAATTGDENGLKEK